jgi:phenylacetic acid degradation operon negative regulatory protein
VVRDAALRPRSGSSAKALLLTILGEFTLPHDGTIWTSTVVRSLGTLGVGERNARQAIARLAERGVVQSEKVGRRSCWHLSDQGRRLLTDGARRIYRFGADDDSWDGRWLVVLTSISEEQRAKRHQLRARLGFAGFGFAGPGVAVSPHVDREDVANAVLKELGLVPGAIVLRAEAGDLVDADELLRRAWDLDGLAARYDDFVASFSRRSPAGRQQRFAAIVELVHEWRRFPFEDPEIPPRLLPARWPGDRARQVFDDRHAAWAPDANLWYEEQQTAWTTS